MPVPHDGSSVETLDWKRWTVGGNILQWVFPRFRIPYKI